MKFAVADPPYPGQSKKHYGDHPDYAGEVDHRELIARLVSDYDGWALHTSAPALFHCQSILAELGLLPMDPETFKAGDYRVGVWAKPMCAFKRNVKVAWSWEPVLLKALRPAEVHRILDPKRGPGKYMVSRDHIEEPAVLQGMTMKKGLTGVKPERVCHWVFEMAGLHPDDEFHDLYPGSGAVTKAWHSWCGQLRPVLRGAA